jgi:hypothetical protein
MYASACLASFACTLKREVQRCNEFRSARTTLRSEAVKKSGQAPSRPPVFQRFRGSHSEPVPFFHSRSRKAGCWRCESARRPRSPPASRNQVRQATDRFRTWYQTSRRHSCSSWHTGNLLQVPRPAKPSCVPVSNSFRTPHALQMCYRETVAPIRCFIIVTISTESQLADFSPQQSAR